MTRLLDRLGDAGYVDKATCETDLRVTYAVLTDAGAEKLEQASGTHVAAVEKLFGEHLSCDEIDTLVDLLTRLPGGDDGSLACESEPEQRR